MNPFVIAIANEKGGVAKTTTTLSLGACLSEMNYEILLIDLDPQANLSLSVGTTIPEGYHPLVGFFSDSISLDQTILSSDIPQVSLIPSQFMNGMAEMQDQRTELLKLKEGFSELDSKYGFILIDCPPHLGYFTRCALSSANLLILPTQAEYFSIHALGTMMNLVKEIRDTANPNLTYKLLLTMYDGRNRIHRTLSTELRNTFGSGVFNTIIEIDTRLRESQIAGMPISSMAPSSRSSIQYHALAQEIETYAQAKRN